MEQLKARDSEVESMAMELEQTEKKVLALEEAKEELSSAAEKAQDAVGVRTKSNYANDSHNEICLLIGSARDKGGGSRSPGRCCFAKCSRGTERLCRGVPLLARKFNY